ncbi:hypothetical protein LTS08_007126 [Lithohypha guttulata]|uniref:Uncharacterized protein n=1 Tax=Lithohypha guttulata TaxID=1690604 RepID=A0AAN7T2E3_9EURO|nr:hypothetical protein LTR51_005537 [Lithohypha guttulata]KAK5086712.1 hypothetical protein LTR05_003880 [Lithohypha guttulata]KAK5097105.1 hypothetical protein LTS08_007126 [Lithohypha guttulata]
MTDAQAAVTDALNDPVEQNRASAEDAKKMLAELEAAEAEDTTEASSRPENNGATNGSEAEAEDKNEPQVEDEDRSKDREYKRRDRDDRDRGRRDGRGRGRGRGNFNNRGGGVRSVLTSEEKSSDQNAIRKQVEFYFSDSNLPMDQFLLDKVGGNENHAVELDIICSFKRMRHFEPREAIIEALRTSKTLRLVDDDTKVQRKNPLPKSTDNGVNPDMVRVHEDKAMPRTVYVKGFGEEKPSSQFDIEAWFAQFGATNAVRLRRTEDKTFKGSAFCEFETDEMFTKFLEMDPKPKYQDREMLVMSKREYCDKKADDIKAGKIKPNNRFGGNERGRGRGRGGAKHNNDRSRRDRGDDNRDWRERREEDRRNGFRDDKRRDDRDNRDKRGGRERRRSIEKDDRGIPVVKTNDTEREDEKADAIAKAKAIVENAEKQENDSSEVTRTEKDTPAEDVSKKREREEDTGVAEEPAAKKVDAKADA